jgi:hypothetical protein
MWPFGRTKVWTRLAAASAAEAAGEPRQPVPVAALTTIVSSPTVVSPFSGVRASIVVIELVERIPLANEHRPGNEGVSDFYESLGTVVLGDVATLRDLDGDEITIVVRRARVELVTRAAGATPLVRAPAEVVPLLRRATGRGVICYREVTLGPGEKILLKAAVEPSTSIVTTGDRSGTRTTYVTRDDLAPVVLVEVVDPPRW